MTVRHLTLVSISTAATTYRFETAGPGFRSWALCTVNDDTGELLITSDWGSWSYRWDARPSSLGHPTLTAFIGTRANVDYLARKLQSGGGRAGRRWSAEATARTLRQLLCAQRLGDGREQLERRLEPRDYDCGRLPNTLMDRYTEAGLPLFSGRLIDAPTWREPDHKKRVRYLDRDTARRIWDEIGDLADEADSPDLLYAQVLQLDGFTDYVTDEPWHHSETAQTPEDRALRDLVLPALIAACRGKAATTPEVADADGAT